jgi:competence protein ComEC
MSVSMANAQLRLLRARPMVGVAIALMVGIGVHHNVPAAAWAYIATGAFFTAAAFFTRGFFSTLLILLSIVCAGTALSQLSQYQYAPNHIAHYASDIRRLAQLELSIDEAPRIVTMNFGQTSALPPRQACIAHVVRVKTIDGWQPSVGRVLVQIAEPHAELAAGQIVRVIGLLDRPAPSMNPGQFDWANYYRQQRTLVSLHIPHAQNIEIIERHTPSWRVRWCAWTRAKLADGFDETQSLDHALLRALVLGDPDPELRDVQEQFRATGTSHHIAISGMHIALVGGTVFVVLRLLRLQPRTSWLIASLVIGAYGLAALPSAPVVRSLLLWAVLSVGVLMRRPAIALQALSIVVVLMLVWQPLDLFNAGFQLSFGTVLGLILLTELIVRRLDRRDDIDRAADAMDAEHSLLLWLADRIDRQMIVIIAAGIAAWLVSMPIVASHFTQMNPWAIFSSIALGPIVFAALLGGLIKIVFSVVWPSLAWLWADAAQVPVALMRRFVDALTHLPFGDVPLPGPPVWVLLGFYIFLLWIFRPIHRPSVRLISRVGFVLALMAIFIFPYVTTITRPSDGTDTCRVTVLAVGAGQCIVIEPPGGRVVLIDAGTLSMADPIRRCIGPFLRQRGITSIDTVFISHANTDHYNAVGELVPAYGVRDVAVAGGFSDAVSSNAVGAQLLASLVKSQRPPRVIAPGQIIPLAADTSLQVVWPPVDAGVLSQNDRSLVLRLQHKNQSILFTGDIQDDAMRALVSIPPVIHSNILIAPHHGSFEATTDAFVNAVKPDIIIASNDRTLSGKQMSFNRLMQGRSFYRTHTSGAVTLILNDGGVRVQPLHSSR